MNISAKSNKNNILSNIAAVFMGTGVLLGVSGCGGGGGGGTPAPEPFITKVTDGLSGAEADGHSLFPSISADGRYVVFESDASNLVSGDTNNVSDIFLRDMQTGSITRVSVDSSGAEGDGVSTFSSITADGRYVAFKSLAENLVANDGNGAADFFRHDTQSGTTIRVSVDTSGTAGSGNGFAPPSISADGRYIAFESGATDLVIGDTNGQSDIFLRDTLNNTTLRISVVSGSEPDGGSFSPVITADGNIVTFASDATNLVANDGNAASDIFIRDIDAEITARVSVVTGASGVEGNDRSFNPIITPDGRFVLFSSNANNFVSGGGDTNGQTDSFVRDTQNNTTTRISIDSNGGEVDSGSFASGISADGRYTVFTSAASNLISGGASNGLDDVYVHDAETGETIRVSVDSSGIEADGDSKANGNSLTINADGRYVVFSSKATNLLGDDTNGVSDVYRVLISKTP